MNKIALTAFKARQLADKAGLIAEPKSQWKWALRKLRKPNPSGEPTKELLRSGKDLADTKEKTIGLLSNNQRQKLDALQRKQRLGVETALDTKNTPIAGEVGTVSSDKYSIKAHTHPRRERALYKNSPDFEVNRLTDETLKASPSGQNWKYTQREATKTKQQLKSLKPVSQKKIDAATAQREKIIETDVALENKYQNFTFERDYLRKKPKNRSTDDIKKDPEYNNLLGLKEDYSKALSQAKNKYPEAFKKVDPRKPFKADDVDYTPYTEVLNRNKKINDLKNKAKGPEMFEETIIGGDTSVFFSNPKIKHNIVSDGVTGVHKPRNHKLPRGTRSVYFKKGLEK